MRFLYIVILPVLFMLCSCGSASVSESMEEARMALDRDDYRSAKSICDDLRESKTDSISENIGVLCDLSIFYMKIADSAGRDDNMDIAKQCYIKAFSINPVAARDYYSRLDVDDMAYGALLESMVGTPESPVDELSEMPAAAVDSLAAEYD
ncbi:MAG TPA: hypothetical protein PK430_01500 [Muribaculum sp.]|jgi:hypothetical protein|uniref:Lipoprotein n=1 Tax=Heminiphilus faecis TaxID=2601703 RepID=A0ABV4CT39_9BACT|nr:hypothetical protein [Heminiphilus faecis]RLT77538.1 hypothetical protein D7V95_03260 [bacterium J10(2018)]HRF67876.1 hypothetical protein [Muribaculum sp.]